MTNAETIAKLNEALEKLIKGYEELQDENIKLSDEVDSLKEEISNIKEDKKTLEENLNTLENHTQKDSSNISNMLDKIEGLLVKKRPSNEKIIYEVNKEEKNAQKEVEESKERSLLEDNYIEEEIREEKDIFDSVELIESKDEENTNQKNENQPSSSENNTIDLNRMASLLNGFNNK